MNNHAPNRATARAERLRIKDNALATVSRYRTKPTNTAKKAYMRASPKLLNNSPVMMITQQPDTVKTSITAVSHLPAVRNLRMPCVVEYHAPHAMPLTSIRTKMRHCPTV